MMVSKKQRQEIEEMSRIEEDLRDNSEASFDNDLSQFSQNPLYSSNDRPDDIYKYKRMRLVPNSEAEFVGLIDKDVVLANVKDKKPDPEYLRFISETIVALEIFSKRVFVNKRDKNGDLIMVRGDDGLLIPDKQVINVPDPEFNIIRQFLRASFKSDLTLSRAMGKDREAVLDRSQMFGKSINKAEKSNKYGV